MQQAVKFALLEYIVCVFITLVTCSSKMLLTCARVFCVIAALTHAVNLEAQQSDGSTIDDEDGSKEFALIGVVIDDATGQPIADAKITAVSRNFEVRGNWTASTNKHGEFSASRKNGATVIQALSADGKLGAIAEVPINEAKVELRLVPLSSATGRLMRERSKPAANLKIQYGVKIKNQRKDLFEYVYRFGGELTTDANGDFTLHNLVPGVQYPCNIVLGDRFIPLITAVAQPSQAVLEIGELIDPTFEKKEVPRAVSKKTPLQIFGETIERTKLTPQNVLITFGDPASAPTQSLMSINSDEVFRTHADFLPMTVFTIGENRESANKLAQHLNVDMTDAQVVIVNPDGQLIARAGADELCEGDNLSKQKLYALLDQHRIEILDAKTLLDDALKQAAAENKRVMLQETGVWCAPCYKLSRLLTTNRQWEQDYVWVKIDRRWTGASDVMLKLQGNKCQGIPWLAILDASGKLMASSNMPNTGENFGYPSNYLAQDHFANMFKMTRQRMTDQDINDLATAVENSGN